MMASVRAKTPDDYIAEGHTPMMAQYHATKAQAPDCLLFYRMGDFFELFYDDAVTASRVLDIALTKRGTNKGSDIAMCGVPAHSFEPYLAKLIHAGHKVALCEQLETPEEAKKRGGSKALVRREITRIVTPGTLTEDHLLDSRTHNFLASIADAAGQYGCAWLDLSTGDFFIQPLFQGQIDSALSRINPSEVIIPERLALQSDFASIPFASSLPNALFSSDNAQARLESFFGVGTLESFGAFSRAEIAAAGALIDYVDRTQKGRFPHLLRPRQLLGHDMLDIDPASRRSLEILRSVSGEKRGSLLSSIDRTITPAGARALYSRLSAPLQNIELINARLDQIESFLLAPVLRQSIRVALKDLPDIGRALARITVGRGTPRDLAVLRDGLSKAEILFHLLLKHADERLSSLQLGLTQNSDLQAFHDELERALSDDLPVLARDGGFIRKGFDAKLDELKNLRDEGRRMIVNLQSQYCKTTGIENLKIAHNNILGYYIEVSAKKADPLLLRRDDNPFVHRQTMASAVRFTTKELIAFEQDLLSASEKTLAIELEHFSRLCAIITNLAGPIHFIAHHLAEIDVASSLAELAESQNYSRPILTSGFDFTIEGGRHPVVEQALERTSNHFVPNSCALEKTQSLWLLTGPNMAGKSTFLRQNALIVVLAQAGCFVPATSATLGIVDRLFSRVGASDDLARGRSTFMVEMVETAAILHQATERSLVILDEIGRGTATYDGLSIAWACVEYLHAKTRARTIFATHYHELTQLEEKLAHLSCFTMAVKDWQGGIVFLHEIKKGAADKSYGIHVAQLAGLPEDVTTRAQTILAMLEDSKQSGAFRKSAAELPLFNTAPPKAAPHPALEALKAVSPDDLSPKDALEVLYLLKSKLV